MLLFPYNSFDKIKLSITVKENNKTIISLSFNLEKKKVAIGLDYQGYI